MVQFSSFRKRTARIKHQCLRWGCPLLKAAQPAPDQTCPIAHKTWAKGGCIYTEPAAEGARFRRQLDRHSEQYQLLYNQRTACERIFSQAVALGIERPKLRNQRAIENLNTLIYVTLNLRALQRVLDLKARSAAMPG